MTRGYQFGTFKGVFTPSILTILGVIMYLRFGWVLGNVGLASTLLIVTLSTAITFLTGLSLSALATNMKIGGGGAYYMISRSLGVEVGGAIGLPLFLAQAFGVSFYVAGFSESITRLVPTWSPTLIGIVSLVALTLLAYRSADLALRMQFIVLTMIAASLVSFFAGSSPTGFPPSAETLAIDPEPFWAVFAVFFPAVTGIEAGLAMSGDLRDPSKSLPRGTLAAVGTSYLVYLAIPIFLSRVVHDQQALMTNSLIMRDVAAWGPLILLGLWGAALSSAMGSLLGAPRTLQALARDGVVPRVLGRGFGPGNDPRIATAVTVLVGLSGILAGGLNVIAAALSMFFLTSYGLINLSAALEGLIESPSWRPTFRVPWIVSLCGACGCFGAMLMINPGATFVAGLVSAGVYALMKRRRLRAYWGDLRYGILRLAARLALYRLARHEPDERTWKPNLLVLSGAPTMRWYLIALADAISHGKGFLTVASILPDSLPSQDRLKHLQASIQEYLTKRRVPALVKLHTAPDVFSGAQELIQAYGFGPLVPNTILLGETERTEHVTAYVQLILLSFRMRRNLIIVRESESPAHTNGLGQIDVWWTRNSPNVGLMLALGYLLQTSPEWRRSTLVLKTVVEDATSQAEEQRRLETFIAQGRLEAKAEVVLQREGDVFDTIRHASGCASFMFLGMRAPQENESAQEYGHYYNRLLDQTEGLPPTALVLAAEDLDLQRIFEV